MGATRARTSDNRLRALGSLTAVRRQTAIESDGLHIGVPAEGSLRAMRVILRQTPFEARLLAVRKLNPDELGLLAAAVLAFRRAGTGRNRGRGRLNGQFAGRRRQLLYLPGYDRFVTQALGLAATSKEASS